MTTWWAWIPTPLGEIQSFDKIPEQLPITKYKSNRNNADAWFRALFAIGSVKIEITKAEKEEKVLEEAKTVLKETKTKKEKVLKEAKTDLEKAKTDLEKAKTDLEEVKEALKETETKKVLVQVKTGFKKIKTKKVLVKVQTVLGKTEKEKEEVLKEATTVLEKAENKLAEAQKAVTEAKNELADAEKAVRDIKEAICLIYIETAVFRFVDFVSLFARLFLMGFFSLVVFLGLFSANSYFTNMVFHSSLNADKINLQDMVITYLTWSVIFSFLITLLVWLYVFFNKKTKSNTYTIAFNRQGKMLINQ